MMNLQDQDSHAPPIDLYEDNAGGLYLHQREADTVYQTDARAGEIIDNYIAIAEGQTGDWSEEWVYAYNEMEPLFDHPETVLLATWYPNGRFVLHSIPGSHGQEYLQKLVFLETEADWYGLDYPYECLWQN